jgi:hypothetical protein
MQATPNRPGCIVRCLAIFDAVDSAKLKRNVAVKRRSAIPIESKAKLRS